MNELLEILGSAGSSIVDGIIAIAETLTKTQSAPGVVAAGLGFMLLVFSVWFFWKTGRQRRAIRQMRKLLAEYRDEEAFSENYEVFQAKVGEIPDASRARASLRDAWQEFSETVVADDLDGNVSLRNSIRPAVFMNVEDLGYGPGWFRILPNLFVSLGLLMTFLGLVAALHGFSGQISGPGGGSMDLAMQDFMQIASAKFIMSLAGLVCSILFNIFLRVRSDRVAHDLQGLCVAIERRLSFVSLEDLAFRQLRAADEQREHLRQIGLEMVAELRQPLEVMPDRITTAITERMEPIFDKVGAMGSSNMEGLVGDLSSQLSHSVGNALTQASVSLGEATDRIGLMVDRMNASNAQAGEGLQTALSQLAGSLAEMRTEIASSGRAAADSMTAGAEQMLAVMNETLGGIRENTARGAEAMGTAAADLRQAAEGFREQLDAAGAEGAAALQARMAASTQEAGSAIEGAGKSLLDSFEAVGTNIARLGAEMGGAIGDDLMGRIQSVGTGLQDIALALADGAESAKSAATGMKDGANAITGASTAFGAASRDMRAASEPLRASHERIETSLRRLEANVETVSATLTQNSAMIAENAQHVLETAQSALGTEREGIQAALGSIRAALSTLTGQAEQLDRIDEMLGRALRDYNAQLDSALGTAQDHVTRMRDTLAPGIDTLKGVVEQAENFIPSQRRL
ncbi:MULTISPECIES: hypothetical protein [Rhodobacterales]|uniref:hypothetical protein n=1 Tax=Rhodobacterales TaxID=204455 RepID=UPI0011087F78|nr:MULTISPECIES: hypothetical protein [Rhodobacterales]